MVYLVVGQLQRLERALLELGKTFYSPRNLEDMAKNLAIWCDSFSVEILCSDQVDKRQQVCFVGVTCIPAGLSRLHMT